MYSLKIFSILYSGQFLFFDQVYFSRLSEKSVKNFVENIWARLELKLFAIPTDFMGWNFAKTFSRSQTFKQTIQIISDNGILNWKPKSISFENQILNLKIFLHLKLNFFYFEQWKNVKRIH